MKPTFILVVVRKSGELYATAWENEPDLTLIREKISAGQIKGAYVFHTDRADREIFLGQ